jgi:hypothetical protein
MTDFQAAVIICAVPAIWILIAIVFANAPDSSPGNSRKNEEDDFTIFSSVTDPSQSYLTYNVWHDDD